MLPVKCLTAANQIVAKNLRYLLLVICADVRLMRLLWKWMIYKCEN